MRRDGAATPVPCNVTRWILLVRLLNSSLRPPYQAVHVHLVNCAVAENISQHSEAVSILVTFFSTLWTHLFLYLLLGGLCGWGSQAVSFCFRHLSHDSQRGHAQTARHHKTTNQEKYGLCSSHRNSSSTECQTGARSFQIFASATPDAFQVTRIPLGTRLQ